MNSSKTGVLDPICGMIVDTNTAIHTALLDSAYDVGAGITIRF